MGASTSVPATHPCKMGFLIDTVQWLYFKIKFDPLPNLEEGFSKVDEDGNTAISVGYSQKMAWSLRVRRALI